MLVDSSRFWLDLGQLGSYVFNQQIRPRWKSRLISVKALNQAFCNLIWTQLKMALCLAPKNVNTPASSSAAKSLKTRTKKPSQLCRLFLADRYTKNSRAFRQKLVRARGSAVTNNHPFDKRGSRTSSSLELLTFVANLLLFVAQTSSTGYVHWVFAQSANHKVE